MFEFSLPPHFLSANAVNNSMFLSKRLTINKRYLDNCSLSKTIVIKLIFVIIKKQMSKTQAKNLTFKFVPFLFIAVTILTTFGSNSGTWA